MSGNLLTLLRSLSSRKIEFIVIGGMAGVLHGAPVVTADLDIVHKRSGQNVAALLTMLKELSAVFRGDPRMLEPLESHLMGRGHILLTTKLGPLDLLCEVQHEGYEELVPHTKQLNLGQGLEAKVVTLDKLIDLKEAAGRPKDQMALPILRATLQELRRRK